MSDWPSPAETLDFVGHAEALARLSALARHHRLPHALLLTGPPGIGKACLAYRLARWLLAGAAPAGLEADPPFAVAERDPAVPLIAATAHPDLLAIARDGPGEGQGKARADIPVDRVRRIGAFLRLTPGGSGWRVVIVDGADTLNQSAANALLKVLEEPPPRTVLILTADRPGRLLPTIRSRCVRFGLSPLAVPDLACLLRRFEPALEPHAVERLAALAEGSMARARRLVDAGGRNARDVVDAVLLAVGRGERLDKVGSIGRLGGAEGLALAAEMLVDSVGQAIRAAAASPEGASESVATLAARIRERGLEGWLETWENSRALLERADAVNLDWRAVVLTMMSRIERAAAGPGAGDPAAVSPSLGRM